MIQCYLKRWYLTGLSLFANQSTELLDRIKNAGDFCGVHGTKKACETHPIRYRAALESLTCYVADPVQLLSQPSANERLKHRFESLK